MNQPLHDYSPATDIFLDLNVNKVAAELQLVQQGGERGAAGRPAKDAQTLDDVEHRIVERIESHKQDAQKLYHDHLHTYDQRMAGLDFEHRFAVIRQAAPEAIGDFNAEAQLGRNELFALRQQLRDAQKERDNFKAEHKLNRAARVSSLGKMILKVGILAIMFVFEVVINGNFLANSNEQGLLGGAVQAVSFAALNIIASFLWGLVLMRRLNSRDMFSKLVGLISAVAYIVFAVGLNLTLAHLREIPPTVADDVGQEVLAQLLHAPLVLNNINSLVFFGIGFIFSLVAMADGVYFTDPYPGYAAMEKRWLDAGSHYNDRMAELIDRLRDIRDDAKEAMNAASKDLSVRRGEFDSILKARGRLNQRFVEHQAHIGRACNALLQIYREANRKARKAPPPDYFSKPYEIERIPPASDSDEDTTRDQLRKSIAESQCFLESQIAAIHEAFNAAVKTYREIDELFPENDRDQATAQAS